MQMHIHTKQQQVRPAPPQDGRFPDRPPSVNTCHRPVSVPEIRFSIQKGKIGIKQSSPGLEFGVFFGLGEQLIRCRLPDFDDFKIEFDTLRFGMLAVGRTNTGQRGNF